MLYLPWAGSCWQQWRRRWEGKKHTWHNTNSAKGQIKSHSGIAVVSVPHESFWFLLSIADLAFLAGPSLSKNEYRPATSTNSILPSQKGRLFFLNHVLSRSLGIGVTGELEPAGDSIGNGALPRPRWTKEPVDVRAFGRVIFRPRRNVIQYADTSSGGADFTTKQPSVLTLENVIVVGDLRGFEALEE